MWQFPNTPYEIQLSNNTFSGGEGEEEHSLGF